MISARIWVARCGVEVQERLIEEEYLGLAGDGAAEGDAVAFRGGEGGGFAVEQWIEAEDGWRPR